MLKKIFVGLISVFVLLQLGGCAGTPSTTETKARFYPPLPNSPRIQHLVDFSSPSDLLKDNDGFKSFIFGKETSEDHLIQKPYGTAVHDGKIYVVDSRGSGYGIFDLKQRRTDFIQGFAGGHMKKPINITIDTDGTKYITDIGRGQILEFNKDNKFVKAYGKSGELKPVDVLVVDNKLFVTDLYKHEIKVLDKKTGNILYTIGKAGSKDGELFQPTNTALGPDKNLYVSDTGNFRIQRFTLDGKFVRTYGKVGDSLGHFARPKGVTVDSEGHIYVVDAAFENVQIMNSDGTPMLFFAEAGSEPGNINLPTDISIDYNNLEYFQSYADPDFKLEYILVVASQFGVNKVSVFGFGKMEGFDYSILQDGNQENK
ncbi:MAG: 6-bladed beta-propeller [Gammaproteobacteria bacterium]|nr:6-bladed beta-propeller [Gammaproteobacteria bacterium]